MRIYEGSPRQDFEEVLRSMGAHLDQLGMRDVLILETPDGFIVQGLVPAGVSSGVWSEAVGKVSKETLTFLDDDIARFMEESIARRGDGPRPAGRAVGQYEASFRVIGRFIDEDRPKDVSFFEQDGAFVLRLHHATQAGSRHTLAEFTHDDVEALLARSPELRTSAQPPGPQGAAQT